MNLRTTGATLLLAGAALATWAWRESLDEESGSTVVSMETGRGYYLNDAVITQTRPDGTLRYELSASRMLQETESERIRMNDVRVRYVTERGATWRVSADTGEIDGTFSIVELQGGVRVVEQSEGGGPATTLTSPDLTVDLEAEQAATESPVTLTLGQSEVHAVGLVAYFPEERLELKSAVHGQFIR